MASDRTPEHQDERHQDEHRPAHPTGRAILLMVLVVVFLVLVAAAPLLT